MEARWSAALAALLAVSGCRSEPTAVRMTLAPTTQALVGFPAAVDLALLDAAGVTVIGTRTSPPVARITGDTSAFGVLARDSRISYVLVVWVIQAGDSTDVFLTFRDRPTGGDSLSDADRQAVASAGGWLRYVWPDMAFVDVVVPVWGVPVLKTSPAVSGLEMDQYAYADD